MQELVREGDKLTAVSQLRVPSPIPVVMGGLWEQEVESDGRPQQQLKLNTRRNPELLSNIWERLGGEGVRKALQKIWG